MMSEILFFQVADLVISSAKMARVKYRFSSLFAEIKLAALNECMQSKNKNNGFENVGFLCGGSDYALSGIPEKGSGTHTLRSQCGQ